MKGLQRLDRVNAEESKWRCFFQEPSKWWDNRTVKTNPKFPDFEDATTGIGLWINSWFCPKWVPTKLKLLEDSVARAHYKKGCEAGQSPQDNNIECAEAILLKEPQRSFPRLFSALKVCSNLMDLESGKKIHVDVIQSKDESNIYVANALMNMYAKCRSMADARAIFDKMATHDVVSWTTIILGYAESGEEELALQLYSCLQMHGQLPDRVAFLAALKACGSLASKDDSRSGCVEKGKTIHNQLLNCGYESNTHVANALVQMYASCGCMADARSVFEKIVLRDVFLWTAMILGYAQSGENEAALQLYLHMHQQGCLPDRVAFLAALKACGSLGALALGKKIQENIQDAGLLKDSVIATCLIDFYGKCGSMVDAQQVFDSVDSKDLVTWSVLLAGYSRHGESERVFDIFDRMQKERVQPDGIAFLFVLNVCSHTGLVDKGKEYFMAMCSTDYGVVPCIEHYACMVDLLGRANQLDEALAMVKSLPFEPKLGIWGALLGASRKWTNTNLAEVAFESMMNLGEKKSAAYVLMANIYASAGLSKESTVILNMAEKAGNQLVGSE